MRLFRVLTLCILGLFLIGPSILNLSDAHGENALPQQPPSDNQIFQLSLIETLGRGTINEVAWSPDESMMAIASTNGLWLYETQDYQAIATVIEGTYVSAVAFNDDGSQIAYLDGIDVAMPYRITLWDIGTQEIISTWETEEYVTTLLYSPDSRQLVTATRYGIVFLWDIQDARIITKWTFENVRLLELVFVDDNSLLTYFWDWDTDSVNQWLLESPLPALIRSREKSSRAAVASHDGAIAIADVEDETVRVSNFETGEVLLIVDAPNTIRELLFRGSLIVIIHDEGIMVWNFEQSMLVAELDGRPSRFDIWFSPSGSTVVYPEYSSVKILDILTNTEITLLDTYLGSISGLSFKPMSDEVAVAYNPAFRNGFVRLWQISNNKIDTSDIAHDNHLITTLTYSRDGGRLAYGYYFGSELTFGISIWDAETEDATPFLQSACDFLDYHPFCYFNYIEFSPDGEQLAGILDIQWFNPETHNYTQAHMFDLDRPLEWDFVADENYLPNELPSEFIERYLQRNMVMTYQPESTMIAYNDVYYFGVQLYDVETQETPIILYSHSGEVTALQFSPDGTTLVSGDADGNLIVWDMVQEQIHVNLPLSDANIEALAFHPDGQHFALATEDQVTIYDLTTMQDIAAVDHDNVEFLDFNQDGTILATANSEGVLRLWAVE